MIDPLTALAVASTAVSQFKELASTGRDVTSALVKFAGAWSDISEAERRANNPSFFERFDGSLEQRAAQAFAAKRKAEDIKREMESTIQFLYGPSGLNEYKDTLRKMRETKRNNEYRKAEIKRAIIEWCIGIALFVVLGSVFGFIFYLIGKGQGRW